MDDQFPEDLLQGHKRNLTLFWLVFVFEPLFYLILPWVVNDLEVEGMMPDVALYAKWGFYFLAVILAVASILVHRVLLSDRRLQAMRVEEALRSYLSTELATWSLNGAIPLGGVFMFFLSGDVQLLVILSILGMVLNLLARPRLDVFVERVRELHYGAGRF
jgi:hypothetical protein